MHTRSVSSSPKADFQRAEFASSKVYRITFFVLSFITCLVSLSYLSQFEGTLAFIVGGIACVLTALSFCECVEPAPLAPIAPSGSNSDEEERFFEDLKEPAHAQSAVAAINRNISLLNLEDAEKNSALHIAARSDANASNFYKFPLDPNIRNAKLETPLHVAVQCKQYLSVVSLISNFQALDLNAQDVEGNTPLHIACRDFDPNIEASSQIIRYLLQRGAERGKINNNRERPSDLVAFDNQYLMNQLFLTRKMTR